VAQAIDIAANGALADPEPGDEFGAGELPLGLQQAEEIQHSSGHIRHVVTMAHIAVRIRPDLLIVSTP